MPRKNLAQVGGKPLVVHSILAARAVPEITRVVVSTDDPEIGEVSQAWGATVVPRPPELSGDTATSESALLHVLDSLNSQGHADPELVVFLQATSPLRDPSDIRGCIGELERASADSLFSATSIEGFVWKGERGLIAPVSYDPRARKMRQQLNERYFEENGSIYVFKPWILRAQNSRLGGSIAFYGMPWPKSLQIDRPEDLQLAQRLYQHMDSREFSGFARLKLLVLDFDGVMTNNRVWVLESGLEAVVCNRSDGLGVDRAKSAGLEMIVVSTERNPVVARRCEKLGLPFVQGVADKLAALKQIVAQRGISQAEVGFVGNDVNDISSLCWVGFPIAVADALPDVRGVARYVTKACGGEGAVREVIEWILAAPSAAPGV
jgi:YrbI family 3-deoxy-D-manno-octulosonate 8-phosphate phosphatase